MALPSAIGVVWVGLSPEVGTQHEFGDAMFLDPMLVSKVAVPECLATNFTG